MKPDDAKLRQLFATLRRADEGRTPAFGPLSSASAPARNSSPWPGARRVWAASLAVAAAVGGAVLFWNRSPTSSPDPRPNTNGSIWARLDTDPELPWQSQILFSEWRSPTEALLRSPRSLSLDIIRLDMKPL